MSAASDAAYVFSIWPHRLSSVSSAYLSSAILARKPANGVSGGGIEAKMWLVRLNLMVMLASEAGYQCCMKLSAREAISAGIDSILSLNPKQAGEESVKWRGGVVRRAAAALQPSRGGR